MFWILFTAGWASHGFYSRKIFLDVENSRLIFEYISIIISQGKLDGFHLLMGMSLGVQPVHGVQPVDGSIYTVPGKPPGGFTGTKFTTL